MDNLTRRKVERFLLGLENGGVSVESLYQESRELDELFVYFLLRYIKEKHGATKSDQQISGAGQRLYELLATYPDLAAKAKPRRNEPMVTWFDDSYNIKEFFNKPMEFAETIYEKMEG